MTLFTWWWVWRVDKWWHFGQGGRGGYSWVCVGEVRLPLEIFLNPLHQLFLLHGLQVQGFCEGRKWPKLTFSGCGWLIVARHFWHKWSKIPEAFFFSSSSFYEFWFSVSIASSECKVIIPTTFWDYSNLVKPCKFKGRAPLHHNKFWVVIQKVLKWVIALIVPML